MHRNKNGTCSLRGVRLSLVASDAKPEMGASIGQCNSRLPHAKRYLILRKSKVVAEVPKGQVQVSIADMH